MKKQLIGVVGFYGNEKTTAGGQEAKTCSLTRALEEKYGKENVIRVNTFNWKKHPLRLLKSLINVGRKCKNIFVLPAQNSVKIFIPLFIFLRFFYGFKLYYAVVGGWLPSVARDKKVLTFFLKKVDKIFVEASSMKDDLERQNFCNVEILPNFKFITPLEEKDLNYDFRPPYKLCTFSRVMKEKGIEDAILAVNEINNKYGAELLSLDIYGKIDDGYAEEFSNICDTLPPYVKYCGMVEPEESVNTIKDYFALLFPTHYATEGIPGTIIDAYAAGVPIITSLWLNSSDVFFEGITGWGYEFDNQYQFFQLLDKLVTNPKNFLSMKESALRTFDKYQPEQIVNQLDAFIAK